MRLLRLDALLDAQDLEMEPGQLNAVIKARCGVSRDKLAEASDADLSDLEQWLYKRYAVVVEAKRALREQWESQLERKPLAKIRRDDEPPAAKEARA